MREILMIDDKFPKWHPVLEKTAIEFDFTIVNCPTVEEGLVKLGDYPESFEAVILGLSFAAGGMQGTEGLLKIRELDGNMPVIILTAKTDDFQLISECIRLGAHDYFSKATFIPGHLFLQLENAIQQSNQKKKLISFTKAARKSNPSIPFFFCTAQSDNLYNGFFAYRMNTVACASFQNRHETEYLFQLAWEWHYNLLNTLSFYDADLKLRLRYLFNPGSEYIDPVLVVEFNAPSYNLAGIKFKEIHHEFDLIMQAKKEYGKTVYTFSPVTGEMDLKNVLFPFPTTNFVRFVPESNDLMPLNNKPVGFRTVYKGKQENSVTLPSLLKPEIKLDGFCEQLYHQNKRTMVELLISPVRLTRHEIDYLREIFTNINSFRLTEPEKEKVCSTISGYLNAPSKCFKLEVFQAQQTKRIGENLLSAISTAFFESESHVKVITEKICSENILKKEYSPGERFTWNQLYSLSSIIHVFKFPYPVSASIPGIRSIHPVFGFLPESMNETGVLAGVKVNAANKIPVRIGVEDLRKHLYILGQTGTGKSTLLYSMIMDRIVSGKGVCVIDPHGDLHKKILENLPPERRKDVIAFEPGSPDNKVKINLLEYNRSNPQEKSFLIDDLFSFFRQEYNSDTMGPMFELFMKNALLLLMDDPDDIGSIGDIVRLFQNQSYRNYLLEKCRDQEVVDFWNITAEKLSGDISMTNMTPYVVSKLNKLLINEYIRPIVSTKKSNIDFREVIDGDKILLVSLSKGKIGGLGVNVLGSVILSRIINAALSREDIAEEERRDFTLFIDEFQNFLSNSLMFAMSESRKYRLSLVLANQTLGQLNEHVKQSVLGNVGSTIFFRPGINDVDYIMPYFVPYLTRENVLTLPNYKCIGRIQINNTLSLPFIFDTIDPDKINEIMNAPGIG